MYKVPYPPPHLGGEFINSVGEEYQVLKRGRDYQGNILFPLIFKMLGRISSGEEGKGALTFGKVNQDLDFKGVGKNIKF